MASPSSSLACDRVFAVAELRQKIFNQVFHIYEGDPERHLNHGRDLVAFWYCRLVSRRFKIWVEDIFTSVHIKHTQILLDFGKYMVEGRHPEEISEEDTPQYLEAHGKFDYGIGSWKSSSSDESNQENYFHNMNDHTDDSYRPRNRLEIYCSFARWGTAKGRSKYMTGISVDSETQKLRNRNTSRSVAIFSFNSSPDTFVISPNNCLNKGHRYYKLCQERWKETQKGGSTYDSDFVAPVWTAGVQVWNMYQDMELPIVFMSQSKMEFAVEWRPLFGLFFEKERSLRYLRAEKVRCRTTQCPMLNLIHFPLAEDFALKIPLST
jgi:hypothetical protein